MSSKYGIFLCILSNSLASSSIPNSRAIAGICNKELLEPDIAA